MFTSSLVELVGGRFMINGTWNGSVEDLGQRFVCLGCFIFIHELYFWSYMFGQGQLTVPRIGADLFWAYGRLMGVS